MKSIKTFIVSQIMEELETQIGHVKAEKEHSINESKAHKGAMVSRYDTFKEEAQYLASGLSIVLTNLDKALGSLNFIKDHPPTVTDKGSIYTIIEVKNLDDNSLAKYFLLPAGGGNIYEIGEEKITVLNVAAPLARAFIGTKPGDEVKLKVKNNTKRFKIISVT